MFAGVTKNVQDVILEHAKIMFAFGNVVNTSNLLNLRSGTENVIRHSVSTWVVKTPGVASPTQRVFSLDGEEAERGGLFKHPMVTSNNYF